MPRHDRAYGHWFSKRAGGGSTRRTRTPKNTYGPKQAVRSPLAVSDGRKDGNTQKGGPVPQAPKETRKGGQPPTIRKPAK